MNHTKPPKKETFPPARRTAALILASAVLFLTGCRSAPPEGGRFYKNPGEGCVSAEEYYFLTGIYDSPAQKFALQIPRCPATSALLEQSKKSSLVVYDPLAPPHEESPAPDLHDHELHTYAGYTLCYRESYEQAEWAAYHLTRQKVTARVTGRTNDFRADTLISTRSADPADYKGSGYDRGHLVPAADMEWSKKSAHDSFLMSNMSPQRPGLNRGLWKILEEQVRTWACEYGSIYVVTGPVLEKDAERYGAIGKNRVAVPEYFYKALLVFEPVYEQDGEPSEGGKRTAEPYAYRVKCAAFILPNESCGKDIYKYICSVDEAEKRTGLDFFPDLPDEVEDFAESRVTLFSAPR